ncbi:hypothetical protein Tsubulata_014536 [Turnera subulata]|uniref:TmcB/TmcC TPR repeats domain-containing protein n=1 Tax=Turnera subulata TaxID=218843 RepID=A0A9Q0J5N9_9ROSI|nr:hypothetical protein Tsubulata_014536 [Turnera subulata]
MKSVLLRTGSIPAAHPAALTGSPRRTLPRQGSFSGSMNSPRISLHLDLAGRRRGSPVIRRALSEAEVIIRSESLTSGAFPARILEDEEEEEEVIGFGGMWPVVVEELGFSAGDGFGEGKEKKNDGGGRSGGGRGGRDGDVRKIGDRYREMLKSNPGDSLLLRNYGKYLHEVEGDMEGAEEYYGRAILASPGDGELLSLYGKLIWDSKRDGERAKSYFDQAVLASPDDCSVMGSYAHFMWEADEDEEEAQNEVSAAAAAMVAAF